VVDVTGAGDSLVAGYIYGLGITGDTHKACVYGRILSHLTLQSEETVSRTITTGQIEQLLEDDNL
ncbi:MAG: PfkB family carbohydrate kinase, partial [Bacilli bacterium]